MTPMLQTEPPADLPPLIRLLLSRPGCDYLDALNLDRVLTRAGTMALFLTEDPKRYPETNDVAVVLPELIAAHNGAFRVAVVDRELEKRLQESYQITIWPSLVFLRDGRYLGTIAKMRDWSEYMTLIAGILQRQPTRNPGIGVPVVAE